MAAKNSSIPQYSYGYTGKYPACPAPADALDYYSLEKRLGNRSTLRAASAKACSVARPLCAK